MKIINISQNYNQQPNLKSQKQSFKGFAKLELYPEAIPGLNTFSGTKKVKKISLEVIENIAKKIKEVTQGKVNVYRRSLDDMGFRAKYANEAYAEYARTIFIEDNNGLNKKEMIDAIEYLYKTNFNGKIELYIADLFKPKPKGILSSSNLGIVAYGAKPEQMIKL